MCDDEPAPPPDNKVPRRSHINAHSRLSPPRPEHDDMDSPSAPAASAAASRVVEAHDPSLNSAADEPVVAHYTALLASLISQLAALVPPGPPPALHAADALSRASTWADLRLSLRNSFASPEYIFGPRSPDHIATKCATYIVLALARLGAATLARDVVQQEKAALAVAQGGQGADQWAGLVELLAWMRAVKRVLSPSANGTSGSTTTTPQSAPTAPAPRTSAPHAPAALSLGPTSPLAKSTSPAATASSSSFGFAPPPAPGTLAEKAKKLKAKKDARLSSATSASPTIESAPSSNAVSATPEVVSAPRHVLESGAELPASTDKIAASEPLSDSSLSAVPSIRSPELPAAPVAGEGSEPSAFTASTSTAAPPPPPAPLPSGPPSAGFAPPAAPGTAFEKPLAASKPRSTSSTPAPAAGTAERPTRRRRAPLKLAAEHESDDDEWDGASSAGGAKGRRGKRRSSVGLGGGAAKKRRAEPLEEVEDDDSEVDELASDYEEQVERKLKAERERQKSREREEEANRNRFAVGTCVLVKFPNYSWFPAVVLDPATAPPETQGKRVKSAYLVKSIPSGGDHRWVAQDDGSILAIQPTQLDDILLGRYKSPPPQSWVKWRSELVEAVMLIKSPERLVDWLSRPTDLEVQLAAKAEKKRAAKAASYW
ncbi:hypothetical protein JCM9279_002646 [Rhodotorula babjevae]